MNNLRNINVALLDFRTKNGHFPPAVVMGPDGKTPYSWRVALLPFLDQAALYKQYRLNEPWDSEHNMKLAKVVVPVYHNPNDDKPTNSSYFAVVGKNTLFGNTEGSRFRDITDGVSNVIALVEAKRDIPWTKPEDIKYDGEKIPKFGGFHHGGFSVVLCDGSVKFISEKIDEKVLHELLQINDGQPVP
ncbi:MAG: DUF1559 domain-containing protein [Planctomycetaceae bacterium]|nr:DUF1559 domain-containing protein [Planctomycetaceae bacterium]